MRFAWDTPPRGGDVTHAPALDGALAGVSVGHFGEPKQRDLSIIMRNPL